MDPDFLSDIDLYYAPPGGIYEGELVLSDEDYRHAVKVMRKNAGDRLFVTDGLGSVYHSKIVRIENSRLYAAIESITRHEERFPNYTVYMPRLRNDERLEFALEKGVELGFTKFVVFYSRRTIEKKARLERWEKIALAAMKQSLNTYLPAVTVIDSLSLSHDKIVLFDQASETCIDSLKINRSDNIGFLFGPEGSFTGEEVEEIKPDIKIRLLSNRLRSETAIVSALSYISLRAVLK